MPPEREGLRTIRALAEEARRLAEGRDRCLLGIAGAPGAGKSTLASGLLDLLAPDAAVVGLDGFHLANRVLVEHGLLERKGAPETFDAAGFRVLLGRLRTNDDEVVYAPEFHREIDEPIAGAVAVPRPVTTVIVEGNYLLLDDGPWRGLRDFFDAVWYLDLDGQTRRDRLLQRHIAFGKSPEDASSWVRDSDERNAALVEATAGWADKVVRAPLQLCASRGV